MNQEWLMRQIRSRIEEIINEEADKAAENCRMRIKKEANTIAIRLLENFSCYSDERKIVIEVKKFSGKE